MLKTPFIIKKKAVIYVRVSTEKQAKEGHGLEGQEKACRKLIDYHEFHYLKTYKDKAVSGTKENSEREGMSELMRDAEKKIFDVIVIYKLDRLGRTGTIVVNTVKKIIDVLELRIISCSEDIDTSKPSGRLVLTMFSGIAEYEKDIIVERLTMGREQVLKNKGETGGLLAYGYIREEKKISILNEKANIVKVIFKNYEDGYNMEDITRSLNKLQIPAPKSDIWYSSAVRSIINHREKYEGAVRNLKNDKGERWPIILTDEFKNGHKYISNPEEINNIKIKSYRTAIYIRITNIGGEAHKTVQENDIKKYMADTNLFLVKTYIDVGQSSKLEKRKGLQELLSDIKRKNFDILLVHKMNVFGHTDTILEEICDKIKKQNIAIVSVLGY